MAIPSKRNGFSVNLLPKFYQTDANKKFLQSTVDQLYRPGTLTKTSGYIGRKNAKASTGEDVYVKAADSVRQNYQLEPAITIKDNLDNVVFYKDYIDYINQLSVFGGNTSNHTRLNNQEMYSWDPHIDWDKFVNFQNYYWLPYGPETITVYGHEIPLESSFSVQVQAEGSNNQYIFTPDGLTPNPVLRLYKGQTYTFYIDSIGNPFSIKTLRSTGTTDRYIFPNAIDNYAVESGTITFVVPIDAPSILYYQSETDINLGGTIQIYAASDATSINVESEILGKVNYTLSNGTPLSNGMKLNFKGQVYPTSYATGEYYVEGVGTAIKLIDSNTLEIIGAYTTSINVEFDQTPFDQEPFDTARGYAGNLDYILVNRASKDHNPWSRYNRWFHKDVISTSAMYNGNNPSLDQTLRAKRPIIEFSADLRLFNFGTVATVDVDLVDSFTTTAFATIEGAAGYNIDGVTVQAGMLILFTADTDPLVAGKIFQVEYIDVLHLDTGSNQLHLVEVASPMKDRVVLARQGITNQGSMYWYNGTNWTKAQQKTSANQPPLFDIYDSNGFSYGDSSVYSGSTFKGTALFSYATGSGTNDLVLGFPLQYQNVSNIGDIVFNFNLAIDTFQYKNLNTNSLESKAIDVGFLSSLDYSNNTIYLNGWQLCKTKNLQAAIRIYDNSGLVNNFPVDIYDNINNLTDLEVKIYVNGQRLDKSLWSIVAKNTYYQVVLNKDLAPTDILTIRAFSDQPINSNGFYEIPLNLQNNPLNDDIGNFTLGEVIDHVNSIVDNTASFSGNFPGASNLRDLGNITQYGTKFVQHSGPLSLAVYHITTESNNVVKALTQAKTDYSDFKRLFINTASSLGVHTDPVQFVELIMTKINSNKPKVAPYYFSDMVPYGANVKTDLSVVDYRIKKYPLNNTFNLTTLSNKAVGVYLNNSQLLYGTQYIFDDQGFIEISSSVSLSNGDIITTIEYDSTDGSFVPATPTKLGLWPKFEPRKYLDTTLISPQNVIQGHDGSIVLAYNDYRDDILLELEKRIFNNIKVEYDPTIFDLTDIIPSYNRDTPYSKKEFDSVLSTNFYSWIGLVGKDLSTPLNYDRTNSFTYNYSLNSAPNGTSLPGYWRGVYKWLLDTDRPHLCPWEMLGFSVRPTWWTKLYGDAPYTSDNIPMWTDIANGVIKAPGVPATVNAKYVKPFLIKHIPVDSSGNLISPQASGLASGLVQPNIDNNFVFGDVSPVENAWTRSSYYPFSVISTAILLNPAKTFGLILDRHNIIRNLANQLIYKPTGLRIKPADIILPSIYSSITRVQTAGLVNYVVDLIFNYIFSNDIAGYNSYLFDLQNMTPRLGYRVGAFTNQAQFNILLESKTPSSTGNVFIPVENYKVFLNKSSTVKKLVYSGVIITKLSTGFEIKGYSLTQPYFNYYQYNGSGATINVGGISESYAEWTVGQQYIAGTVILYNGKYYRALANFTALSTFNSQVLASLPSLPMTGGATATLRNSWDKETTTVAPYGTLFATVQQVVDFLLGYGEWLKDQGFVFDNFNNNLGTVSNWETSAREFMFWTTQNWSTGHDKWEDWEPNKSYKYATIVRYDGDYYSALQNIPLTNEFEFTKWNLLSGLNVEGASVISLSPSANTINFNTVLSVVDSITNGFNSYEIVKVNGTPFDVQNLDSYRQENTVSYTPRNSDGIYGASFYLVQNEHVIVIDNKTIFNDVIYSPTTGYRQERLKISGYTTTDWYGGLDIPGFIFDSAVVKEWQPWQDYNIGDIVNHHSYYYSANAFIAGSAVFNSSNWKKLDKKPTPAIIPNWTNIATQFTDFYSLEVDSFDAPQQQMAQHLIGYQKRQYLNNIIQDDVSEFKFYQGMIRDKGTQNVLNKLFGVLNSENKESLTFYEEWAIRVSQYGASKAFEDIEFVLDQAKYNINNPQGTVLIKRVDPTINPFIIQLTPNDIYVKPHGYNSRPFLELKTTVDSENGPVAINQFLRSAGYVDNTDVFVSIGQLKDLTGQSASSIVVGLSYKISTVGTTDFTQIGASASTVGTTFVATGTGTGTGTVVLDISQINEGAYFWCAFDGANSWNVYRFTDINLNVTNVTYNKTTHTLTLTTQYETSLKVGTYIGIGQSESIQGFYKIDSITLNNINIIAPGLSVPSPFTDLDNLTVYTLLSQRTGYIDTIDNILPARLEDGNIVWTDYASSDINSGWATWKYKKVYQSTTKNSPVVGAGINFAQFIAVSKNGNTAAVSVGTSQIATYDKVSTAVPWTQRQLIQPPFNSVGSPASATVISTAAVSPDGTWLATGSPTSGSSSTYYIGVYSPATVYAVNTIVSYNSILYQALFPVPAGNTPNQNSVFWNQIFYTPISDTSTYNTGVTANGMITLYQKDANNIYQIVDSILSPVISNEKFGSAIVFDSSNMYVSAPAYNNNTGRVYQFSYTTTPQVTSIYDEVNSTGTVLKLQSTAGISAGMIISGNDIFGNSAFNSDQVVEYVLTRLLFSPAIDTTGKEVINTVYNTSSTQINVSSILSGATVSLYNSSYAYSIPNLTVSSTGLTSINQLVTTHTLSSGGVTGTNTFILTTTVSDIAVGYLIVGYGLPPSSYVGAISSVGAPAKTQITVVDSQGASRAIQNFIATGTGTYAFYKIINYNFVEIKGQKDLVTNSSTLPITRVTFGSTSFPNGDPTLTFNISSTYVQSSKAVILSSAPDLTPNGSLTFSSVGWSYTRSFAGDTVNSYFGSQLALSRDGSTLAVSAIGGSVGKVYVYQAGVLIQTLTGFLPTFGQGITVSDDGTYIAVSDNTTGVSNINQRGSVGVYQLSSNNTYQLVSNLVPHTPETNGEFGTSISFMNDYKTLAVYSRYGSSTTTTTFDKTSVATTFDKKSTNFITTQIASGRVDVYDRYNVNWVYSESLPHTFDFTSGYGQGLSVGANNIFVGAPLLTVGTAGAQGLLTIYSKDPNAVSWTIDKTPVPIADVSKIKKAFLYSRSTNKLLTYIDIIDPLQGKIAGPAEEELKYKTFYDPATYSYSNGSASVTVNSSGFWSTEQQGQLWWNLSTTKFVVPYFPNPIYRNNTWNTLATGASVDIYEWVTTPLLPSQWDAQSSTPAGQSQGITGTTLYGDSAYSVTKTYNSVTKTFKNTYYYWVKNKTTVPDVPGRHISAQDVSSLISNPRGQGYTYLALMGTDSFSLVNVYGYLKSTDTVLAVEYWTTDKIHQNIHSQWKLISADTIVQLPKTIKEKWIDSLCGVDVTGRAVPDVLLPPKLKYGVENRPRQGMFVNRVEALKQFIEAVNLILLKNQIVDNYNIEDLYKVDPPPNIISGSYDKIVDTDADLSYSINLFIRPELAPIIVNGRITGITIISTGRGYIQPPYITISGSGKDALVRANIDTNGRIQSVTVLAGGIGYDDSTVATVRDYSVLVRSDSQASNSWSIYSFDPTYKDMTGSIVGRWSRSATQAYDVTQYWTKVDWYASGYNQFTAADYSVQLFVDLNFLNAQIGNIVKVSMATSTQWMLLEKYANSNSVDWTQSYRVVGIQAGTIQFNSTVYQTSFSAVGYDADTYDTGAYDIKAGTELRIILSTLQDKILIGDLYKNYLDLFFRSIRYAHSEQPYIDWAFKTSFVRATHNVGGFTQPVYYPVDNLSNFQDYIAEVKPYRTKIREYISQYTNTNTPDVSSTAVTDFDLPADIKNSSLSIINSFVVDGKISSDSPEVQVYPWKFWLDNVGFQVIDLKIVSGGSGYVTQPQVIFTSTSGSGASAQAFFTNGVVNRIILLTKGSGYLEAPTVSIVGGLSTTGTPATVVAILGNSVVRSNLTGIKFDRISYKPYISKIEETIELPGSGSLLSYELPWPPDLRTNKSSITVLNKNTNQSYPLLPEDYSLSQIKNKINGETQYSGIITFVKPLAANVIATLSYVKDTSVLNSIDRINFNYNPISGMVGKEYNQLMLGVDYGGTIVGNLGFTAGGGWSEQPYGTDKWDSFDPTFTDYTVTEPAVPTTSNPIKTTWTLPYVPASGTAINVYWGQYTEIVEYGDGVNKIFPFNFFLYPTVFLANNASAQSSTVQTKYSANANGTNYPISTTTVAVATGVGGASGQSTIIVDFPSNIFAGQFVSGIGVPYNTTVVSVTGTQIILSNNLTVAAVGQSYSFFVLGTVLTLGSTSGLTVGLGLVGTAFNTQTISKIIDATTIILNRAPDIIPVAGDVIAFVTNAAGSSILTVNNTSLIQVGDSVYTTNTNYLTAFGITVKVKSIDSATQLTLDQILYLNIADGINIVFRRDQSIPKDFTSPTNVIQFAIAPSSGTEVHIIGQFDPIRIDAGDYDDVSGSSPTNPYAVMQTIYANGHDGVVSVPAGIAHASDSFIFRQETSDGSIAPADRDTDISGGDLAYTTASGIAADDIILDGDGLVTPTSSPAPEEVVPGQVVDTLAIKVFDRPSQGSARIKVDNYIADGSRTNYTIGQQPVTVNSILVKVTGTNGNLGIQTLNTDYTIDYENSAINFAVAPSNSSIVTIFNIGYAGENILDLDYFIGDGITTEFITQAPWLDNFTATVFVDGVPAQVQYFQTDSNYVLVKSVGIRFINPPALNTVINYIVVSGSEQTFAITNTERISTNGSTTYQLQNLIGNLLPNETYMIVRVDQQILPAPVNSYFTVGSNQFTYTLNSNKIPPYSINASSISVLVGNNLLLAGRDYTVDLSVVSITITTTAYTVYQGKTLVVSVLLPNGYTYNASTRQITFAQSYDSSHIVEVLTSYEHDSVDLERTEVIVESNSTLVANSPVYYSITGVSGGLITLERSVIDENYIWVTKNSTLLVPGVDYRLNDDRITVQLAIIPTLSDVFEVLTYGTNVLTTGIAYVQFKDMTNKTSFTRLSLKKRTTLAQDLLWTDTSIVLTDASNFQVPSTDNKIPGIIEIQGERIQYYAKNGNVLSQLRRGILGTGIAKSNPAGTYVQDISSSETIPYKDTITVQTIIADGSNFVSVDFVPVRGSTTDTTGILEWFAQRGYTYIGTFNNSQSYNINDVVVYNGQYYYCTTFVPQTSLRSATIDYTPANTTVKTCWSLYDTIIPPNFGQSDQIEVFVGGYKDTADWSSGSSYAVGDIVNVGSYTYQCQEAHTSGATFFDDITVTNLDGTTTIENYLYFWKFFIGNIRLKKQPYSVHNVNIAPYSPAGDVRFDADFAVDGSSARVRLTNKVDLGTRVTVYQRTGTDWDGKYSPNILVDTSEIAQFIKAEPGIWYAEYNQISNKTLGAKRAVALTFDAPSTSFDQGDLTMDQG